MSPYASNFSPSSYITDHVLKAGRITAPDESPPQMIERVVRALYHAESTFSGSAHAKKFSESIGALMDDRKVVFSTPIMTNAGRTEFNRPLSACTVPPISLRGDFKKVRKIVNSYHQEAMGTGFNFDEVEDPVSTLLFLNDLAVQGSSSGKEDRPVGNMGICSIDHPRIVEFITCKQTRRDLLWKFNISINTPEAFWHAVQNDSLWRLANGYELYANELLSLIVQSAHACADPGLVFMDRVNRDNPVPASGNYHSIAPCGEVGLIPGETCQFGYINLAAFCSKTKMDLDGIKSATETMIRALDNCLELSTKAFSIETSAFVSKQRRKVGIGICGLADALISMGIPYASDQARHYARDVVAFINYHSKIASHELAHERGSFGAMNALFGCKYTEHLDFLSTKYGHIETRWVSGTQWKKLGACIKSSRMLRNSSTIALPPTGRSALVINASTGVEPVFSLIGVDGAVEQVVRQALGAHLNHEREQEILAGNGLGPWCNPEVRMLLQTSREIGADDHLKMVASLQQIVDESISKTINLPNNATIAEVRDIYMQAYTLNLKGITMYRDGASRFQPRKL